MFLARLVLDYIAAVLLHSQGIGFDRLYGNGHLLVDSLSLKWTSNFFGRRNMSMPIDGLMVWKVSAPQRVRLFLRLLQQNHLLTNRGRVKRGMDDNAHCVICGENVEIKIHVVRNCRFVTNVWRTVVPSYVWTHFFSYSLEFWLEWNIMNRGRVTVSDGEWTTFLFYLFYVSLSRRVEWLYFSADK